MPGSEQSTPPLGIVHDDDEPSSAEEEFGEAVTAVTEERKLSEKVRRELEFREKVREYLKLRATENDDDDGGGDGDG